MMKTSENYIVKGRKLRFCKVRTIFGLTSLLIQVNPNPYLKFCFVEHEQCLTFLNDTDTD